ncbi:MAG: lipid-A-disaccharide synthase [Bdellovibrionota bacterium]
MVQKNDQSKKLNILIIAAEASSTHYAEKLLKSWKDMGYEVNAFGIGSQKMEEMGFERFGKSEELAVMGIQEVLGVFDKIWYVFHKLIDEAKKRKPDCVLLLDYPDFNLRIAKKLKKAGFKIFYYISPQIWAWRTGRVHFIKKYIDKVLVLFPFEVDFYKKYGVDVEFVGHPLLDDIRPELFDKKYQTDLKQRYGIKADQKVLGLMPGSRNFELNHHLPVQLEAAEILRQKIPNLSVMLFVAPNKTIDQVKEKIPKLSIPLIFVQRDPFEMVSMADYVICASGTATLTVGLMEKPMVIMYIMKKLTVFFGQFIMKRPKFFGMSNLIPDKMISKEFFQEEATGQNIAAEAYRVLSNPAVYDAEVANLKELKTKLGSKGANKRVAESVLKFLGKEI